MLHRLSRNGCLFSQRLPAHSTGFWAVTTARLSPFLCCQHCPAVTGQLETREEFSVQPWGQPHPGVCVSIFPHPYRVLTCPTPWAEESDS